MISTDRRIALIHASRVPPYRILQRLRFSLRLRGSTRRAVTAFAGAVKAPAERFDPEGAAAIAAEIQRLRALSFFNTLDAATRGDLVLRGQRRDVGPLASFDWRRLAKPAVDDVNWFYELSYMGFLAPLANQAEGGRLAVTLMAGMETAGEAGAWPKNLAWKPIAVANRLMNLIAIADALRAAGVGGPAFEAALLRHGAICEGLLTVLREDHLQFNHQAFNITALMLWRAATGRAIPAALERDLIKSLKHQVLADGGHAERSPTYHIHVLSLAKLASLVKGISPQGRDTLDRIVASLARSLAVVTHPDGDIALFNDAALSDAPPAIAFLPADWAEAAWLVAPDLGYARISSDRITAIVDGGLPGPRANPGHAHADYLSCEVSFLGQRLITDFGASSYVSGPERDRTRGGPSHNGPSLADRELIEFAGAFRVGRYSRAHVRRLAPWPRALGAWCSPYFAPNLVLARALIMPTPDILIIADAWSGGPPAPLRFLLPAAWTVESGGGQGGVSLTAAGGEAGAIVSLIGQDISLSESAYFPVGPGAPARATRLTVPPQAAKDGWLSVLALGPAGAEAGWAAVETVMGGLSVKNLLGLVMGR